MSLELPQAAPPKAVVSEPFLFHLFASFIFRFKAKLDGVCAGRRVVSGGRVSTGRINVRPQRG
jgi:hypothetical protein